MIVDTIFVQSWNSGIYFDFNCAAVCVYMTE